MWRTPEFKWLLADILDRRLDHEAQNRNLHWSRLIRIFRSNGDVEKEWARYIALFRSVIVNPEAAPLKTATDVVVTAPDFDGKLHDFLSECMTPVKLSPLGLDSFRVIVPVAAKRQPPSPDFLAMFRGDAAAVEVKNLRAHECVETIMPDLFYDEQAKGLSLSRIRLVVNRSFRGTLNKDEKTSLRDVIRRLPQYEIGRGYRERLSERAHAMFRLVPGVGDAICQDFIGLDDLEHDVDVYSGLLDKISANIRDALEQLHSPTAHSPKTRVIAMRWDIPHVSIPFPAALTEAVLQRFFDVQRVMGLKADLHVFTDHDYVLASTL
jgi:hypothetical protein